LVAKKKNFWYVGADEKKGGTKEKESVLKFRGGKVHKGDIDLTFYQKRSLPRGKKGRKWKIAGPRR